jgi:hypothetical protein
MTQHTTPGSRLPMQEISLPILILTLALSAFLIGSGGAFAQQAQPNEPAKAQSSMDKTKLTASQGDTDDQEQVLPPLVRYRVDLGFKTLYFTTIPLTGAVLLIILALWFGNKDIKEKLMPFFGGGQFGQYIVVILVAGNVCTLAIVGILGRTEVAAIYGGIVGYVLGKKTSDTGSEPESSKPTEPRGAH